MASRNILVVGDDNYVEPNLTNVFVFGTGVTGSTSNSLIIGPSITVYGLTAGPSGSPGPTGPTGPAAGPTAEAVVSPFNTIGAGATLSSAIGQSNVVNSSLSFAAGLANTVGGNVLASPQAAIGNSNILLGGVLTPAGFAFGDSNWSQAYSVLVGAQNRSGTGAAGGTSGMAVALGIGNLAAPSGVALGIGASGLANQTVIGGTARFTGSAFIVGTTANHTGLAFLAGEFNDSLGEYLTTPGVAVGVGNRLYGGGTVGIGSFGSMAFGWDNALSSTTNSTIAFGAGNATIGAQSSGILAFAGSVAVGLFNTVDNIASAAFGIGSTAEGGSLTMGLGCHANNQSASYGINSYASGPLALSVGRGCTGVTGGVAMGIGASGIAGEVAVGGTTTFQGPVNFLAGASGVGGGATGVTGSQGVTGPTGAGGGGVVSGMVVFDKGSTSGFVEYSNGIASVGSFSADTTTLAFTVTLTTPFSGTAGYCTVYSLENITVTAGGPGGLPLQVIEADQQAGDQIRFTVGKADVSAWSAGTARLRLHAV